MKFNKIFNFLFLKSYSYNHKMLKSIFYIFFIPIISIYGQEVLFNDFKYDMPIHDAKVILKNKPDWFKNLS